MENKDVYLLLGSIKSQLEEHSRLLEEIHREVKATNGRVTNIEIRESSRNAVAGLLSRSVWMGFGTGLTIVGSLVVLLLKEVLF